MVAPSIDIATVWIIAEKVLLPATVVLGGWAVKKLNAIETRQITIEARQVNTEHILTGVDGKNGIKSDVRLLVRRVRELEDDKIERDAVEETERAQHPGPDRRAGARRLRDVLRDAHEERITRALDPEEE